MPQLLATRQWASGGYEPRRLQLEGAAPFADMADQKPFPASSLDREQFKITLHLKALRLQANQCQEFVKALKGCATSPARTHCTSCQVLRVVDPQTGATAGICWTKRGSSPSSRILRIRRNGWCYSERKLPVQVSTVHYVALMYTVSCSMRLESHADSAAAL